MATNLSHRAFRFWPRFPTVLEESAMKFRNGIIKMFSDTLIVTGFGVNQAIKLDSENEDSEMLDVSKDVVFFGL
jgi:hypothetical protein